MEPHYQKQLHDEAVEVCDSEAALSVYAAPGFEQFGEDFQQWLIVVIAEAQRRAYAAIPSAQEAILQECMERFAFYAKGHEAKAQQFITTSGPWSDEALSYREKARANSGMAIKIEELLKAGKQRPKLEGFEKWHRDLGALIGRAEKHQGEKARDFTSWSSEQVLWPMNSMLNQIRELWKQAIDLAPAEPADKSAIPDAQSDAAIRHDFGDETADALSRPAREEVSGEEVERVARAIHGAKMAGHNPDCLYQHHDHEDWPVDDRREYTDPFTGEPRVQLFHKAWRRYEAAAIAAIAAMNPKPAEAARKVIERAVADDLIRAIYKAEGWEFGDKGGFDTKSARCNSLYTITADARRNRYVATPIISAPPAADVAGLREALKPFARAAEWWAGFHDFQRITTLHQHGDCLEVGHLRAAEKALAALPEGGA